MRNGKQGWGVLLLLLVIGLTTARAEEPDVVLEAMGDELSRTMEHLQLGELSPPYFVQYQAAEVEEVAYTASFGGLVGSTETRQRHLWVDVRVGDYSFDSSNFMDMQSFGQFRLSSGTTTLDDDYDALRQDLWLLTDGAYKTALEQLSRKRALKQGQRNESEVADFSREEPVVFLQPKARLERGERGWEEEVKACSALCKAQPGIEKCDVSVRLAATTRHLVNSEGTRLRQGRTVVAFEAVATALAVDGYPVNNFVTVYGRSPEELPSPEALRERMQQMLAELKKLRGAERLDQYAGPVLVESAAAGPLLANLLGTELDGGSPPQGLPEMMFQRELAGRLESRILPDFLSLVDDPTRREFDQQLLLGSYEVDDEGVPAQKVTLVEDGRLRSWLMSRRPGKDLDRSNGHGRASLFGEAAARPANLLLQTSTGMAREELEEHFLELCREEGREFCLVVERMNDVSFMRHDLESQRGMMAMAQVMMGSGKNLPTLVVYKVYAEDGRRELVCGATLSGLRVRNLRDVVAAGEDYAVHSFLRLSLGGGGLFDQLVGMFGGAGAGAAAGLPTTVVAPSLLFEELEIRKGAEEPQKTRVVPPPEIAD